MKKKIIGLLVAILTFCLAFDVNAVAITTDGSTKGKNDTNSYLVTNDAAIMITNAPASDTLVALVLLEQVLHWISWLVLMLVILRLTLLLG